MVVVFASFIAGGVRAIELFGLSLASAVLLDAIVVRTILLPAVLEIIGRKTWAFPQWLDRKLPRLAIEPAEDAGPEPIELERDREEAGVS
jgi:RND superfamily putative drug exporter